MLLYFQTYSNKLPTRTAKIAHDVRHREHGELVAGGGARGEGLQAHVRRARGLRHLPAHLRRHRLPLCAHPHHALRRGPRLRAHR